MRGRFQGGGYFNGSPEWKKRYEGVLFSLGTDEIDH